MKTTHFRFEQKVIFSKKSYFSTKKLFILSQYLEIEKNSGKTVPIKQPFIFHASQLCFYDLGTEIRGF